MSIAEGVMTAKGQSTHKVTLLVDNQLSNRQKASAIANIHEKVKREHSIIWPPYRRHGDLHRVMQMVRVLLGYASSFLRKDGCSRTVSVAEIV